MCPGQTPETYRRAEKRTWTSRRPNRSQVLSPYTGCCKARTSSHELNHPPDGRPVRRLPWYIAPSVEPQNHYTWAACFCNWLCWAIISPRREIWGVGFTYFLPWGFSRGKDLGKSCRGTAAAGRWHVGWGPQGWLCSWARTRQSWL